MTIPSWQEPCSAYAILHRRTAWEIFVEFSLSATLVACSIVAVLLVWGAIWLLFRKRNRAQPNPRSSHQAAWQRASQPFISEEEEWEAIGPYPEHAVRAVHGPAEPNGPAAPPFHNAREPDTPDPANDLRQAWESFQDALEQETQPAPASTSGASATPRAVLHVRCPRCLSSRIDTRNLARKAGSTIGSVAGATGGMAAALAGAETGAVVGSIAGPLGTVFGGLAGAVIAGLVGSAAGCAAGSAVGGAIDDNVLDNKLCLACGHTFSVAQD